MSARTRIVLLGLLVVVLALAVAFGLQWWTHGRFVQSTNDAYLQADQVTIAPRVQGYVEAVLVGDNQAVTPGQPLVRIDAATYQATLAQQQAELDARRAEIATSERQVVQQRAAVERAQAELAGADATAAYAGREAQRYATLSGQGVETRERAAQARNQADQASATAHADRAALRQASDQVATLQAQIGQSQAQVAAAEAQLKSARINLGDTLLRSSIAGRVGDRSVRVGQFVQPGVRLMSIVPTQDTYLVANFKETQIGRMRVGQRATVKIDALGGRRVDAVVDSFAPGAGSQFALLPPENATGNFTKIVQRVPVRLRLQASDAVRDHLLPGLSATVSIDTTQAGRS
jgi:membrane fusion protein, multidrug efflux system